MESILAVLNEMQGILTREERVELAARLGLLAASWGSPEFTELATSLDVWGGSGSVVDVAPRNPVDDRRFNELIVDLAEALDCMGIGTPRTRWVGQTIEDWLIAHPI